MPDKEAAFAASASSEGRGSRKSTPGHSGRTSPLLTTTSHPAPRRYSNLHKRSISDVVASHSYDFVQHDDDSVGAHSDTELDGRDREPPLPSREGQVAKWTNYIHGWQERYLVLRDGTLSYFKSAQERTRACRGSIDVIGAVIKAHDFDALRFDVVVGADQLFYVRATSTAERDAWVADLRLTKDLLPDRQPSALSRRPSTFSLASGTSANSAHVGTSNGPRIFKDKLAELKSIQSALGKQALSLHTNLQQVVDEFGEESSEGSRAREAAEEAVLFKVAAQGTMSAIEETIALLIKREEDLHRRYERERQKRKQLEEELDTRPDMRNLGPDYVEGPHTLLNDDEFYDALETGLDQLEAQERHRQEEEARLESQRAQQSALPSRKTHRFTGLVDEQLQHSLALADEDVDAHWALGYQEGQLKVFRRESAESGTPTDRLKAFHYIPGISGRELAEYFFNTDYKTEWEHTIESFRVLEFLDQHTNVTHMIHKRVWPSAQRDSCFVSHFCHINEHRWAVLNYSVDHDMAPQDKFVRLTCAMFLLCDTDIQSRDTPQSRKDVGCRITYVASINPGGWAPPSVVKAVSQREYPKFLKNLEKHVLKHYEGKPLSV
ncbi:uncharacterized protein MONBRDRAFT_32502 [Monosiga brevicollis MX1]|uniref:Ceramide transfer protein n=1 Tax=Monosiga brevicollis TaxID=81824 RepID=A9UZX1_MONBE|nr:uncharacterized protein MONBRDRAFT_32502 [Monosiga brevicollis MX1]EDQ88914.1 predicted protein [Monosiga brevicollis MX1]|eukprot:XP_001746019.1 hypothetical protein [Monosiga brevicollis MX1]